MKNKIVTTISVLIVFLIGLFVIDKINSKNNDNLKVVKVAEVAHSIFYAPQYVAISNGYFEEEFILILVLPVELIK